ncbi:probable acyl-[acyl-carrier-protein]--UDP-N-acetylglucosamine O-acyltransferase, mitochondrial isoform X2 [Tripterygium wilfordii]|uniref:probable acyl-[acyl-carrier-protein]--UDP-N-acetylglucosamine O-acyltransferase, mitochondrial isoform X2 n=1 Tax=Tripterygium wilfordii TaxID=458696 RepID=UPI0018F83BED|nr:probable acyl-[acyl-carrier-protein]--UDP-N-acetylglucosamine O-acyltransferase, mitochondrial isoform X2 [Tripterygium wilfordii]
MNSLFKIQHPLRSALTSRFLQRTLAYASNERKAEASPEPSPSFIHPTAVVHPDAIIGQGVSVGPFCTVGSSATIGNGCKLYPSSHIFGDTKLGERCVLMTGAVVGDDLPGSTVIGCNNVIGHHAVVGVKCQDLKYKPGDECFLNIGDNNDIREHASIHRSSKPADKTVIGDDNLIMGSSHIAHDCKIGNNNIFANNTLLAGHVIVGDYTHTAGAIVVHQFCHIGSFSFIGGGSVVSQDVPMYVMVSGERAELRGLNLEGLRRRGFSVAEIRSLRTAYRKIFVSVDSDSLSFEECLAKVYVGWCSLFVALLLKVVVEYATLDDGAVPDGNLLCCGNLCCGNPTLRF